MKDPFSSDFEVMPVTKVLLEKDIQSACVKWMRQRGYWARKFSSPAQRSVPDYLFSHVSYDKFATEFKAPGKRATDKQKDEQQLMRDAGWEVWQEEDDIASFKEAVLNREALLEIDAYVPVKREKEK